MNKFAYELGYSLGLQKEAGPISFALKALGPAAKNIGLGQIRALRAMSKLPQTQNAAQAAKYNLRQTGIRAGFGAKAPTQTQQQNYAKLQATGAKMPTDRKQMAPITRQLNNQGVLYNNVRRGGPLTSEQFNTLGARAPEARATFNRALTRKAKRQLDFVPPRSAVNQAVNSPDGLGFLGGSKVNSPWRSRGLQPVPRDMTNVDRYGLRE